MENQNIERISLRQAQSGDLSKLLDLLGSGNTENLREILLSRIQNPDEYLTILSEDLQRSQVIGLATAFIEQKYIREGGKVCHLEKITLLDPENTELFQKLSEKILEISRERSVYKVIHFIEEGKKEAFISAGFQLKGLHMEYIFS